MLGIQQFLETGPHFFNLKAPIKLLKRRQKKKKRRRKGRGKTSAVRVLFDNYIFWRNPDQNDSVRVVGPYRRILNLAYVSLYLYKNRYKARRNRFTMLRLSGRLRKKIKRRINFISKFFKFRKRYKLSWYPFKLKGVPRKYLPKIFRPFRRSKKLRKNRQRRRFLFKRRLYVNPKNIYRRMRRNRRSKVVRIRLFPRKKSSYVDRVPFFHLLKKIPKKFKAKNILFRNVRSYSNKRRIKIFFSMLRPKRVLKLNNKQPFIGVKGLNIINSRFIDFKSSLKYSLSKRYINLKRFSSQKNQFSGPNFFLKEKKLYPIKSIHLWRHHRRRRHNHKKNLKKYLKARLWAKRGFKKPIKFRVAKALLRKSYRSFNLINFKSSFAQLLQSFGFYKNYNRAEFINSTLTVDKVAEAFNFEGWVRRRKKFKQFYFNNKLGYNFTYSPLLNKFPSQVKYPYSLKEERFEDAYVRGFDKFKVKKLIEHGIVRRPGARVRLMPRWEKEFEELFSFKRFVSKFYRSKKLDFSGDYSEFSDLDIAGLINKLNFYPFYKKDYLRNIYSGNENLYLLLNGYRLKLKKKNYAQRALVRLIRYKMYRMFRYGGKRKRRGRQRKRIRRLTFNLRATYALAVSGLQRRSYYKKWFKRLSRRVRRRLNNRRQGGH